MILLGRKEDGGALRGDAESQETQPLINRAPCAVELVVSQVAQMKTSWSSQKAKWLQSNPKIQRRSCHGCRGAKQAPIRDEA